MHMSYSTGTLFWISGDVSSGFQTLFVIAHVMS